jgi:hypothetical protein
MISFVCPVPRLNASHNHGYLRAMSVCQSSHTGMDDGLIHLFQVKIDCTYGKRFELGNKLTARKAFGVASLLQ